MSCFADTDDVAMSKEYLPVGRAVRAASAPSCIRSQLLCALLAGLLGQAAGAAESITDLKQLSVEDLMNVEVTSVARHPEKLISTASAIQVITQEDIRRSGATSIP